jgi:hypothetical protein
MIACNRHPSRATVIHFRMSNLAFRAALFKVEDFAIRFVLNNIVIKCLTASAEESLTSIISNYVALNRCSLLGSIESQFN